MLVPTVSITSSETGSIDHDGNKVAVAATIKADITSVMGPSTLNLSSNSDKLPDCTRNSSPESLDTSMIPGDSIGVSGVSSRVNWRLFTSFRFGNGDQVTTCGCNKSQIGVTCEKCSN